uniref:type VI secretion system-associated protein TagO n=1 Tax=Castellaniella defragrans TaxID=75697 RepID=UPI003341D5BE
MKTMKKTAIILCMLASSGAWASSASKDDLAVCAAKSNAVDRLECFDALAEKVGATVTTTNTTSKSSGKWSTSTDTDPMTDESIHFAMLRSSSGTGKYGDAVVMTVRCKDKKTEMYINWKSYLGRDTISTTYRVGKDKAKTSKWDVSTDHKAAFFPGSPVSLLKAIAENDSFVASLTPYSESPVTASFDTTGAAAALADIRKGCGW